MVWDLTEQGFFLTGEEMPMSKAVADLCSDFVSRVETLGASLHNYSPLRRAFEVGATLVRESTSSAVTLPCP